MFSSFKSTHPSPVILKERVSQGAYPSNNSETSTTSKQTREQQRPRAQSSLSLNFHTCERRTQLGPFVNWRERDMFVQHQLGSVFIPSIFFQHCLSFLCGSEMLKLHFSDVGSLEVCACRQVSAGKGKGRGEEEALEDG